MQALEEVALEPGSLVVGDLHLDVLEDSAVKRFEDWLAGLRGVPRLVILGDLFEYWIGQAQARSEGGRRALAALAEAVREGTAIDVIPGNRDFLLGARFEKATGARVRPRGLVGRLPGGGRVLFLHGDELATLDHRYQRLRSVLRSWPLRWLGPRLPRFVGEAVARRLRRASRRAVADKPAAEMELQADACRDQAQRHGARMVVCGHAHRFREEELEEGLRWVVVDAFGGPRDTLRVEDRGELGVRASRDGQG